VNYQQYDPLHTGCGRPTKQLASYDNLATLLILVTKKNPSNATIRALLRFIRMMCQQSSNWHITYRYHLYHVCI